MLKDLKGKGREKRKKCHGFEEEMKNRKWRMKSKEEEKMQGSGREGKIHAVLKL